MVDEEAVRQLNGPGYTEVADVKDAGVGGVVHCLRIYACEVVGTSVLGVVARRTGLPANGKGGLQLASMYSANVGKSLMSLARSSTDIAPVVGELEKSREAGALKPKDQEHRKKQQKDQQPGYVRTAPLLLLGMLVS